MQRWGLSAWDLRGRDKENEKAGCGYEMDVAGRGVDGLYARGMEQFSP